MIIYINLAYFVQLRSKYWTYLVFKRAKPVQLLNKGSVYIWHLNTKHVGRFRIVITQLITEGCVIAILILNNCLVFRWIWILGIQCSDRYSMDKQIWIRPVQYIVGWNTEHVRNLNVRGLFCFLWCFGFLMVDKMAAILFCFTMVRTFG